MRFVKVKGFKWKMKLQTFKNNIKTRLSILFPVVNRLRYLARQVIVSVQIHRFRKTRTGPAVFYLTENFPLRPATRHEYAHGGAVKMTYLAETFPHAFPGANILYAVSSVGHRFAPQIVAGAKKRGLKIIVNQNGVAYPAWHGPGWEKTNQELKAILDQADYILYQSRFCQLGAEHFLSPPEVHHEILYNPVDTELFKPVGRSSKPREMTLILGGNQYERYRFELAIRTLSLVAKVNPGAKLIVTGNLWDSGDHAFDMARKYIVDLGVQDQVVFTGTYVQRDAPDIFARGHILLHTKINDPSPTIVLEALSSGVPVVYLDSGGTPELAGEAGIGVPVKASWEKAELPDPHLLSEAVVEVMDEYQRYSQKARQRAVELFGLEKFIQAHARIFEAVLAG
jgi:glycosyltransferase involved in cell wall biosynthesis